MALEVVPTTKQEVTIDRQRFVFECVTALKRKRFQTSALIGDPETLSELFGEMAIELGLQLKSEHPKEEVSRFWQQNRAELLPLIAEHMRENPMYFERLIASEQQNGSGSQQTQSKNAKQMPKKSTLDATHVSKTAADNSTEGRHEVVTETNQKRSEHIAKKITRTELEETIQNLRTEINNTLERRQKEFVDWQFWIRKEIESMTERTQKLSGSTVDLHEDYELSPEPARTGKSHLVKRSKIWGTLDTELEYLLKKEAKRKGVTFSRILDCAIWNFLKKPPLSFQKIQQDDED